MQSIGSGSSRRSADGGEESTSQAEYAGSIPVIGSKEVQLSDGH
jgi:hypothetical protein